MRQLYPGEYVHVRESLRHTNTCISGLLPSMKDIAGQWVQIRDYWGIHEGRHCYYIYGNSAVWSDDCFDIDPVVDEDESTPDITELL